MQVTVSSWGNSLGVRIPKPIAELIGVHEGSTLVLEMDGDKMVFLPVREDETTLEALAADIDLERLVARVTPKNRPDHDESDAPFGSEVW